MSRMLRRERMKCRGRPTAASRVVIFESANDSSQIPPVIQQPIGQAFRRKTMALRPRVPSVPVAAVQLASVSETPEDSRRWTSNKADGGEQLTVKPVALFDSIVDHSRSINVSSEPSALLPPPPKRKPAARKRQSVAGQKTKHAPKTTATGSKRASVVDERATVVSKVEKEIMNAIEKATQSELCVVTVGDRLCSDGSREANVVSERKRTSSDGSSSSSEQSLSVDVAQKNCSTTSHTSVALNSPPLARGSVENARNGVAHYDNVFSPQAPCNATASTPAVRRTVTQTDERSPFSLLQMKAELPVVSPVVFDSTSSSSPQQCASPTSPVVFSSAIADVQCEQVEVVLTGRDGMDRDDEYKRQKAVALKRMSVMFGAPRNRCCTQPARIMTAPATDTEANAASPKLRMDVLAEEEEEEQDSQQDLFSSPPRKSEQLEAPLNEAESSPLSLVSTEEEDAKAMGYGAFVETRRRKRPQQTPSQPFFTDDDKEMLSWDPNNSEGLGPEGERDQLPSNSHIDSGEASPQSTDETSGTTDREDDVSMSPTADSTHELLTSIGSAIDGNYSAIDSASVVDSVVDDDISNTTARRNFSRLSMDGQSPFFLRGMGDVEIRSPLENLLHVCEQDEVLSWRKAFPNRMLKSCKKIGEGTYGEVFRAQQAKSTQMVALKVYKSSLQEYS